VVLLTSARTFAVNLRMHACMNSRARGISLETHQITNNAVTSDEKEGDGIVDLSDLLLATGVNYNYNDEA